MNVHKFLYLFTRIYRHWPHSISKQPNVPKALVFRIWIIYIKSLVWQRNINCVMVTTRVESTMWAKTLLINTWHVDDKSAPEPRTICTSCANNRLYKPYALKAWSIGGSKPLSLSRRLTRNCWEKMHQLKFRTKIYELYVHETCKVCTKICNFYI